MSKILLRPLFGPATDDLPVEVVERKGRGHPDTICDALAEEVSRALLRAYDRSFGVPLHHNVDKTLLWAGAAEPAFGGGEILRPMRIYLAGRATSELDGVGIPVREIAEEAARRWLRANLHGLDVSRHVEIEPLLRPGSRDLVELFRRQRRTEEVLANDTSCGVGFAPASVLERVVLQVERELSATTTTRARPWIGEDVKVMGVRTEEQIELTLACALIGRHLADIESYADAKADLAAMARAAAARVTDRPVAVAVNVADDPASGSVYLTVTGTSAEAGDDGQAGRGNRVTGLITPYRPMVMESVPGKNPVSHTGKVYAVAAQALATELRRTIPEIREVHCLLLSRIGRPVRSPHLADVALRLGGDSDPEGLRPRVEPVVQRVLDALPHLWRALAADPSGASDPPAAPETVWTVDGAGRWRRT